MATHPMIGKELGNYVIRDLLGEGGMGAVFRAEHRFLGDACAIKVLHGSYANNPEVTQRFFQEAKSAREIGHPSIIEIKDFGQSEDGGLYLVMELLEGRSLSDVIAEGPIPEQTAARIGAALADGLAEAHKKGIVHRDLKPDNIFVVNTETGVKILDFGIAKVLSSTSNTGTGAVLGTPMYMAPEQAKGAAKVGPKTDVYALAVILFEMVTGRPPFSGEALAEVLAKVLFEEPPHPRDLARISDELDAIILQCMAKDPEVRPSGMIEVRDRLAKLAGNKPLKLLAVGGTSAPRAGTLARTHSTLSGSNGESVKRSSPGDQAPAKRSPAVYAVAGLVVVAAAGVGLARMRTPAAKPAPAPAQVAVHQAPRVAVPARAPAPARVAAAPARPTTPPAPVPQRVVVRSTPPGADVLLNGKVVGKTPTVVQVVLPAKIVLQREGYEALPEILTSADEDQNEFKLVRKPTPHHVHHAAPKPKPAAHVEGLD